MTFFWRENYSYSLALHKNIGEKAARKMLMKLTTECVKQVLQVISLSVVAILPLVDAWMLEAAIK